MKSTRFWVAIVAAVLCASALLAYVVAENGKGGHIAVISLDGGELYRIDLDKVREDYTIEVTGKGENEVTVSKGKICVSHADCPDKICVNQGWISDGSTPIVCLPNGLVIVIEGGDGLDAVSK